MHFPIMHRKINTIYEEEFKKIWNTHFDNQPND